MWCDPYTSANIHTFSVPEVNTLFCTLKIKIIHNWVKFKTQPQPQVSYGPMGLCMLLCSKPLWNILTHFSFGSGVWGDRQGSHMHRGQPQPSNMTVLNVTRHWLTLAGESRAWHDWEEYRMINVITSPSPVEKRPWIYVRQTCFPRRRPSVYFARVLYTYLSGLNMALSHLWESDHCFGKFMITWHDL